MNAIDAPCFQDTPLPRRFHLGNRNEDVEKLRASVEAIGREAPPDPFDYVSVPMKTMPAKARVVEPERNRLNEIAVLIRALTYGEMIEFAEGLWRAHQSTFDHGEINRDMLPPTFHKWSAKL